MKISEIDKVTAEQRETAARYLRRALASLADPVADHEPAMLAARTFGVVAYHDERAQVVAAAIMEGTPTPTSTPMSGPNHLWKGSWQLPVLRPLQLQLAGWNEEKKSPRPAETGCWFCRLMSVIRRCL